jgi:hypothetical protein
MVSFDRHNALYRLIPSVALTLASTAAGGCSDVFVDLNSPSADGGDSDETTETSTDDDIVYPEVTPPPLCDFAWGLLWREDVSYPGNIDFISVWVGYETDDGMNNTVVNLLGEVNDSRSPIRGVIPVYYAYMIPFKARVHGGLDNCDGFLCYEGAAWLRENRDYILDMYDQYARMTVDVFGTSAPLIWLVEPGLEEFASDDQRDALSLDDLGRMASDIIDVIEARMPNAIISLFHAPGTPDAAEYWSHFDLSDVDMINTTGMGDNDGDLNTWDNQGKRDGTYAYIHRVTGKYLLVDTGFSSSLQEDTWSIASPEVINARIDDGVFAVHIENEDNPQEAIYGIADNIDRLNMDIQSVCR